LDRNGLPWPGGNPKKVKAGVLNNSFIQSLEWNSESLTGDILLSNQPQKHM